MQRIAYSSSFIPCENQRIIRSERVFFVNRYECFMENKKTIRTFSHCKLSKKATLGLIKILLVVTKKYGGSGLSSRNTEYQK